jgi:hypothetical protein
VNSLSYSSSVHVALLNDLELDHLNAEFGFQVWLEIFKACFCGVMSVDLDCHHNLPVLTRNSHIYVIEITETSMSSTLDELKNLLLQPHQACLESNPDPWLVKQAFRRGPFFFFTEVRDTCRKQFCLFWLPRAVDFKISCSQIPRRAFAGIRTHDPLVESPTS